MIYLALAGASPAYLLLNGAACALGLVMLVPVSRLDPGLPLLLAALALVATALLGERVDGVARWARLGPLTLQPSLILLPSMLVGFVLRTTSATTLAMLVAAAALAIQPDRAMASVLAAGLAVLLILRRDRLTFIAFVAALAGAGVAFSQRDDLPPVPLVEGIYRTGFALHPAAGPIVTVATTLLLVPAAYGLLRAPPGRDVHLVQGTSWAAIILAAALGNYPTPVVGYGASAILGYVLSLHAYFRSPRLPSDGLSSTAS